MGTAPTPDPVGQAELAMDPTGTEATAAMEDSTAALAVAAAPDPGSAAGAVGGMDRTPAPGARAAAEVTAVLQDQMAVSAELVATAETGTTPELGVRAGPASSRVVRGETAETRPRRGPRAGKAAMEDRAPARTGKAGRVGPAETLLTAREVQGARAAEGASSVLAVPVVLVATGRTWVGPEAMAGIPAGTAEAAAIARTASGGRGATAAIASMEPRAMEAPEAIPPMARAGLAGTAARPPTAPVEREDPAAIASTGTADSGGRAVRPTKTGRAGKADVVATAPTALAVKVVPAVAGRQVPAAREAMAGRVRMAREGEVESAAR